jgi:hypothetical protein
VWLVFQPVPPASWADSAWYSGGAVVPSGSRLSVYQASVLHSS